MDLADLAKRVGLDDGDLISLVETFIASTETDLEELRSTDTTTDPQRILRIVHHIKGAAVNLELRAISETAQLLEKEARVGKPLDGPDAASRITAELEVLKRSLGRHDPHSG